MVKEKSVTETVAYLQTLGKETLTSTEKLNNMVAILELGMVNKVLFSLKITLKEKKIEIREIEDKILLFILTISTILFLLFLTIIIITSLVQ